MDLADRLHHNYCFALERFIGGGPGGKVKRLGPWLLVDSGDAGAGYNIAVVAEGHTNPAGMLPQVQGWFAARTHAFRLALRARGDAAVVEQARALGFSAGEAEPSMLLDRIPARRALPAGLTVERVRDDWAAFDYLRTEPLSAGEMARTRELMRSLFAKGGVVMLLGRLEGKPVARSLTLVDGGLAGIYNVYVQPDLRRRGLGRAMTEAAIAAGQDHGATMACLQSTPLGLPLYEEMGFRVVDQYVSWLAPGSA